jgi:predicted nucleic acid-binding protein
LALVVDASVGLKWVLQEGDSRLAQALASSSEELLVPDFWLNEACNVLWLQVHRKLLTPDEARQGLALLRAQVEPTPTANMALHDLALDIGMVVDHPAYDTMYVAFAIATGARAAVAADGPFVRGIQKHPDPAVASLMLLLNEWAAANSPDC